MNFSQTKELNLSNSKLTVLPIEIKEPCNIITAIIASKNKIELVKNFQAYENLQILILNNNNLGKCLQATSFKFEGLSQLVGINLSHNQIGYINGSIFQNCLQLRNIDLSYNNIKDSLKCLQPLINLQILDLSYNEIDNILNFKPLKNKLRNLLCLKLKGNPLENHYSKNYDQLLQQNYFHRAEFCVTKFSKTKDQEIIQRLQTISHSESIIQCTQSEEPSQSQRDPESNQKSTDQIKQQQADIHKSHSQQSLPSIESQTQQSAERSGLVSYYRSSETSQLQNLIPIAHYSMTFKPPRFDNPIQFSNDPSVIIEDSREQSQKSFLSPQDNFVKLFDQDCSNQISRRGKVSSCPNYILNKNDKSGGNSNDNSSKKKRFADSSCKKVRKGLDEDFDTQLESLKLQGNLENEIMRLQGVIKYKEKEIIKVDNGISREQKVLEDNTQKVNLLKRFMKLTFGNDLNVSTELFTKSLEKLQGFSSTIDIFVPEKVNELLIEMVKPLLDNNLHEMNQKMTVMNFILDQMSNRFLISH